MTTSSASAATGKPAVAYRASRRYIQWPAALVILNIVIILIAVWYKQYAVIALFGMMGLAFLTLTVLAATLKVSTSEEGLKQRWILGRRSVSWNEVASIERVHRQFFGDGFFLLNEKGNEIFAVSALPYPDQLLITEAAIKRARLKKDKKPQKKAVLERWVRK